MEIEKNCRDIMSSRRALSKIVILCEGKFQERRTPSSFKRTDQESDARFYRQCVPHNLGNDFPRPEFFSCGDRNDVINTFLLLQQLCDLEPENSSYLNRNKLFAIVDLDLQNRKIDNYIYPDIESIFNDLYVQFDFREILSKQHRIFTTGLIYKEAYFLIPDLQTLFEQESSPSMFPKGQYKNDPIDLKQVYQDIIDNINQDNNLSENLKSAEKRLSFCTDLNFEDLNILQKSLIEKYKHIKDDESLNDYAYTILLISRLKTYWEAFQPEENFSLGAEEWRNQLIDKIARFYAASTSPRHHITAIIKAIHDIVYCNYSF